MTEIGPDTVGYTADEMMTVTAARSLKDGQVCFVGIGLPSEAANLARLSHAPNVVLIYESGTIGTRPDVLPLSIGDGELAEKADVVVSVPEVFSYWLQGGRIDVGFLSAAQIDRYGNLNSTVIGAYEAPDVRLPGAGGAPEIASSAGEVIVMLRQTHRSFVPSVDFVTSYGFGRDGEGRSGIVGAGPSLVITDLGVFRPDPSTHELTLTEIHPGLDLAELRANTGWELQVSESLRPTAPPTGEELEILRDLKARTTAAHARKADDLGYLVNAATEFEFFMFKETPESIRSKGFRDLTTMTPGFFGYSVLRSSVHSEFYHQLMKLCTELRIPLEGLHTETGPGVLEAAIQYCEALEAADRGALFKTYTKILAQRNGMMATFMAKWSKDWPGQSGHIHTSLVRKSDGKAAFHDASKPHNMSDEMRWYVGGQQKLMPELLAMVACTVNSYSRLIPGFWAPTTATWGVENRTCALRVIPGGASSQRVEYRIAAADINPYLALAVAIGSGLYGIENKIEPDPMVEGNAYEKKFPKNRSLPRTLTEASEWLEKSKAGRALFGDAFVEHFAASREWEDREFRRAITDWELARYFEII